MWPLYGENRRSQSPEYQQGTVRNSSNTYIRILNYKAYPCDCYNCMQSPIASEIFLQLDALNGLNISRNSKYLHLSE